MEAESVMAGAVEGRESTIMKSGGLCICSDGRCSGAGVHSGAEQCEARASIKFFDGVMEDSVLSAPLDKLLHNV